MPDYLLIKKQWFIGTEEVLIIKYKSTYACLKDKLKRAQ
jgi:hypothetical protein